MFIVKIYGGLGNQVFQFIFGKYLENKYNVEVKFDFYYFTYYKYREPSILKLVKDINILENKNVYLKYNLTKSFKINRFWNSIFNSKSYFTEKSNFKNLSRVVNNDYLFYFDDYWQSKEYFSYFNSERLHSFFNFTFTFPHLDIIKIHVRRGDYLTLPNSNIFHIQNVSYYYDALNYLSISYGLDLKKVPIWVYTDDIEWVKNNFNFQYNYVIGTEIDDFISLCSSNYLITSNSTFSLAAAYLNYEYNIIITPKNWYKDIKKNDNYTKKLYLPKWKKF